MMSARVSAGLTRLATLAGVALMVFAVLALHVPEAEAQPRGGARSGGRQRVCRPLRIRSARTELTRIPSPGSTQSSRTSASVASVSLNLPDASSNIETSRASS